MFNIDEQQSRVIRMTVGAAFACWLATQIADTSLVERIWNQLAVLTLGAGALRVWVLEGAKAKASR
jgi:hypothetical protein